MTWAGGSFTRSNGVNSGPTTWAQDAAASVGITTARHDTHDEDLADGIDACLNKDGSNSPSAHFTWFKSQYYGGTSGGSANAQTLTMSPAPLAYSAGQLFIFICGFTSTSSWTVNANSLGAKNVVGVDAISGRTIALLYDGTSLVPPDSCGPLVLDRVSTATTVVSTAIETTLYTRNVLANLLGAKRTLKLSIRGRLLNNTGGAANIEFSLKFGSTTLLNSSANITIGDNAASRSFVFTAYVAANNSTSAQKATVELSVGTPAASGVITVPGFDTAYYATGYSSSSEDTTSTKTLLVTAKPSASSASLSCILDNATLELF